MNLTSLLLTADGSHSVMSGEWNASYHSLNGAIQESNHIFIEAGFNEALKSGNTNLRILEIGMGTGLNVLLTYLEAQNKNVQIHYTALEPNPLPAEITNLLNYAQLLNLPDSRFLSSIHAAPWNESLPQPVGESDRTRTFILHKIKEKIERVALAGLFDLVYFDAFAPSVQPQIWQEEIFQKIYTILAPDAFLVTYCAQGDFKRTLKKIGFIVESLPGPARKREMTRAKTPQSTENV